MSWRLRLQYLWRFTVPSEDYCSRRHRLAGAWQKTKGFHGSRVVQFWSGNVLQNKFHIPAVSPCSALSHCWKIFIASASFLTMPESIFLSTATVSVSLQLRKIVDFLRRIMRKTSVIFDYVKCVYFLKKASAGFKRCHRCEEKRCQRHDKHEQGGFASGMVSLKKVAVLLDFVHMREGGPCPNFCHLFIVHFWSKPGPHFLQNANDLNFKLFLGCIHDPQSKYSTFISGRCANNQNGNLRWHLPLGGKCGNVTRYSHLLVSLKKSCAIVLWQLTIRQIFGNSLQVAWLLHVAAVQGGFKNVIFWVPNTPSSPKFAASNFSFPQE